jgi:hypothetical protein
MPELYCSVCYILSLYKKQDPILMRALLVIDGHSVCGVHAESMFKNGGGLPFRIVMEKIVGRRLD